MDNIITSKELITVLNYKKTSKRYYAKFHFEKTLSFEGVSRRSVVLLSCNDVTIGKKTYKKVYCLDVLTGEVVCIVDTNGASNGVYAGKDKLISIPILQVFVADFKVCENLYDIYTLRIVSDIEEIGKCDLRKYENKYQIIRKVQANSYVTTNPGTKEWDSWNGAIFFPDKMFLAKDMNYLSLLFDMDSFCYGTFLIKFTGTKVKLFNGKYQFKIGDRFVNIDKNIPNISEDSYISGYALIRFNKTGKGTIYCKAENLYLNPTAVTSLIADLKAKSDEKNDRKSRVENELRFAESFLSYYAFKGLFSSEEAAYDVPLECYREFAGNSDISYEIKQELDTILKNHLNTYVYCKDEDTGMLVLANGIFKSKDGTYKDVTDYDYFQIDRNTIYQIPSMNNPLFSVNYNQVTYVESTEIANAYYSYLVTTNGAEISGVISPLPTEFLVSHYNDDGTAKEDSLGLTLGTDIDLDRLNENFELPRN